MKYDLFFTTLQSISSVYVFYIFQVLKTSVIFVLVSIGIADPDPTAKLPAPPYTPAPPYHPPTLLHGYTPRPTGYGYGAPAYPPPRHQPSPDYGSPPKCAKHDEKLKYEAGYCLEDEVNIIEMNYLD